MGRELTLGDTIARSSEKPEGTSQKTEGPGSSAGHLHVTVPPQHRGTTAPPTTRSQTTRALPAARSRLRPTNWCASRTGACIWQRPAGETSWFPRGSRVPADARLVCRGAHTMESHERIPCDKALTNRRGSWNLRPREEGLACHCNCDRRSFTVRTRQRNAARPGYRQCSVESISSRL